jgi:hypothetical protein
LDALRNSEHFACERALQEKRRREEEDAYRNRDR